MGTLGRSTRNGRQSASRRAGPGANPYKVKYAAALRELREAAEQQAATAEVLRIVSSSARDPQAVFDVILKSAMRLCDAHLGLINEWNGPAYRTVAQRGAKGAFAKWLFDRGEVKPPSYSTPMRMMQAKRPVQFDDLGKSEAYRRGSPAAVRFVDDAGVRTYLAVPLLRKGEVIGAIVLYRVEVRPFTPRQIALVKTFADQAVIAIENARLFKETTSALARQTSTAEILRVLGGSMTDAQPVFDAIVKNCHELFKECGVVLRLAVDGELRPKASIGATPGSVPIDRKSAIGTCTLEGRTVHIPDLDAAAKRFPRIRQLGLKYGYHSGVYAPLMHKGRAIGAIGVLRRQHGAFDEKDVELLTTFADQAVIAIENVRLFNETTEALEQQTATAEILKVIAGSPTEVQPVFDVIVERAVRLCGARFGRVYRFDGSTIHMVASHGLSAKGLGEVQRVFPRAAADDTIVGRVILTRQSYFIEDIEREKTVPELSHKMIEALGTRRQLTIPMLRAGEPIGAFTLGWEKPAAFDPQEAALLQTFADQAVIAIENVRLFNETKEALDHQQASADILRIVSQSVADSQPAFEAILAAVRRLFGGFDATVWRLDQDRLIAVARGGPTLPSTTGHSVRATPDHVYGIAIRERRPAQVDDVAASRDINELSRRDLLSRKRGAVLLVPFVQDSGCLGAISVSRSEPYKFSEKEVALLKNFAAQAVIAIENARLFNETKEALERQTATADILGVISSSPSDLQPVFDSILANATRLCDAHLAILNLYDGEGYRTVAHKGGTPEFVKWVYERGRFIPAPTSWLHRLPSTREPFRVADMMETPEYKAGVDQVVDFTKSAGARAYLTVPLLKDETLLGTIAIYRPEVKPFTDKETEVVKTFAKQAVIAIENVRLFNETKEALEQQTATGRILQVISSTPADTQPVFEAIVQSAARLMSGKFTALLLRRDSEFFVAAPLRNRTVEGAPAEVRTASLDRTKNFPSRVILDGEVVQVPDWEAEGVLEHEKLVAKSMGFGSGLLVPLLREGQGIGALVVSREAKGSFHNKEIALLRSFADQAVIAIENARLFNETKEALERQTATAEILKVISASPTDVQPVFDAIARSAVTLCGGLFGAVFRYDGEQAHFAAHYGFSDEARELMERRYPRVPEGLIAPTIFEGVVSHSPDTLSDSRSANPELHRALGVHGFLGVPMLLEGRPIGCICVFRRDPGPFADTQIAVLQTFADQAVIAIENVRLFNETKEALERQTAISEILRVISSSPADIKPVLDTVAAHAARICHAQTVDIALAEGPVLRMVASVGDAGHVLGQELPLDRSTVSARAIVDRAPVHVVDVQQAGNEFPLGSELARKYGIRTIVGVPLLREGRALGSIMARRGEVRRFEDKDVALLKTFADQAAIAIENARLFNETKEALERQTATAEILKVISASPTDVQPVFDAIAERAAVLCGAKIGVVTKFDGELLDLVAFYGASPELVEPIRAMYPVRPGGGTVTARAVRDRAPAQIPDLLADPDYVPKQESLRAGYRSNVAVPLLREGKVIGALSVARAETGVFSEKEVGLLQTFADQAVIAIENVRLFTELHKRNDELRVSLEQQTATSELLKVIGRSTFELRPVFEALAQNAVRLCEAERAVIFRSDGQVLRFAAAHNVSAELQAFLEANPISPGRSSTAGRAALERRTIHNPDVLSDPEYSYGGHRVDPYRTVLAVPMLKAGELLGVILIYRHEVRLFSESHIALMETFADQAVIAIENVRLFNETKESLEQQTAISDVLRVISSSPTDVGPVLDAVASRAARICDATDARVFMLQGDQLHQLAGVGDLPPAAQVLGLTRGVPLARAVVDGVPVHVPDIEAEPEGEYELGRQIARGAGWRTVLAVPLMRERRPLGGIVLRRREVRPFTEQQVALLRTFADQAAIAIENVRLFNETKEALEQQTATAEILKVISSTPTDTQPVFDAIADAALHIFGGTDVSVGLLEGDAVHLRAGTLGSLGRGSRRLPLTRDSCAGRAVLDRADFNIADIEAPGTPPLTRERGRENGWRSIALVPMLREGVAIGHISVHRDRPVALDDKQFALLKTFANQAVIAIENVRLFNELQARTDALTKSVGQLTALGEVGQAIGSTLELETVLKTIVTHAVKLSGVHAGIIYEYDEARSAFDLRASEGFDEESLAGLREAPIRVGVGAVGRAVATRTPTAVPDTHVPDYPRRFRALLDRQGFRAVLAVPLTREERTIGALLVVRKSPGEFAPEIVELLGTLATQSALAIQNARLYREIEQKSRELETASRHKSQFLASMSHELRTPLNAILGFNEMILDQVYGEVPPDVKSPLENIQSSGKHLLRLINNVLDLAKIEAGRMELALSDFSVQDTVASVHSTLQPLAAEKGLEFVAEVPADLPLAHGDPGRLAQCLMNLAGNSLKFTKLGRVAIGVARDNGVLRFSVADTGIGIAPDKIESLFTEFKQTDATVASEYGGTGLGLSITKKFVEMHGGKIWVESEPGKGSTFLFEIPLRAAQ